MNDPTGWAWFFGDENFTAPWTQLTASAEWTAREGHSSVVSKSGEIMLMGGKDSGGFTNVTWLSTSGSAWTSVPPGDPWWTARAYHSSVAMPGITMLMGGKDSSGFTNDTWLSTNSAAWVKQNASSGWTARAYHSSVAKLDNSIVLMGGWDGSTYYNDVWNSTDLGVTWTLVNASAGWTARAGLTSVAMPDGSIVLMGGQVSSTNYKNDVWRSTDNGTTWTQVNASAGWTARAGHTSEVMPDGSIVLMGGWDGDDHSSRYNNVWRSTDNGAMWTKVNASAGWTARNGHSSVAMPDGSIVLMGGKDSIRKNDVWQFVPIGSSTQNPSHTYTAAGVFQVALQAFNNGGYNSTRKTGYITVTAPPVASFTANITSGTAPLIVQFNDTSTNTPTTWNWSFGDGQWWNTTTATLANITHTFPSAAGTYTVNLTVGNSAGSNISSRSNYIVVTAPKPNPIFSANITSGTAPFPVLFTDGSLNTTGWAWFFGDENFTAPWTQVKPNDGAGWSARWGHTSVVMPDSSIVLMGGWDGGEKNDVWRSTDKGTTWTQVNESAGWPARGYHSSVLMPDGSIVLMGGLYGTTYKNDTWRSTDNGATWTNVTASPGWSARYGHTSVAMPDGSIVLMGGADLDSIGGTGISYNDVWNSTDKGTTWTQVITSSPIWSGRAVHSSVVMPDGSIVLMGGANSSSIFYNDVWRSTDKGTTWTQVNESAG
ncbi:MAG: kelch repeat-containing protein, partial [Methanomicrobiales archaeon]